MDLFIPFEVVAEEGEGRVGENGGIGLALLDELLQLVQLRGVHFYCIGLILLSVLFFRFSSSKEKGKRRD
jgi:hypothetical protein